MGISIDRLPIVNGVFHPTDLSQASTVAFAHALKLSLLWKTPISILHVAQGSDVNWADLPGLRDTLFRWGLIPDKNDKKAVTELGIRVRKVIMPEDDPVEASIRYLERHPADLIVLATHQRSGQMQWLRQSVSEPLARNTGEMTLFIPHGVSGFISLEDGTVSLKRILIPIDSDPDPASAIQAVYRIVKAMDVAEVQFTLLYVGDSDDMPTVELPEQTGWTWEKRIGQGDIVENILEVADAGAMDMIIMSTHGRDGFLDALRGSTTERVMRGANCPLLAVPAND
jgi:nucleotide-binding universal stress UspA family protein